MERLKRRAHAQQERRTKRLRAEQRHFDRWMLGAVRRIADQMRVGA